MFKVTLETIVNSIPAMRKIASQTMSGRTAIQVARLIREIERESVSFEEMRKGLFAKYGKQEGDQITIPNDQLANYNAEIKAALDEVVEINAEPLTTSLLESIELTPLEANTLLNFTE